MSVTHAVVDSPLGELTLVANDGALAGLYFAGQRNRPRPERLGDLSPTVLAEPMRQLGEYFAGERTAFDLELDLHGDPFDRQTWQLVSAIPHGQTRTYGQLARELGDPGLAQQVGVSNARNRLLIVVPCHRVVGAGGRLTGYAGGLARKRALLDLEAPVAVTAGRLSDDDVSRSARPGRLPGVSVRPFEQIVSAYGPMVLRVCRAVLGPDEAEDAWSEAFLAALRAYPELDADANVEAWLVTIAHRKAIDVTRAAARRPRPVESLPDRPSSTGRPEDWDGDLWAALAALPPRQRVAVAYHYLAGLSYAQVAAIIGGSTDAARRAAADGIKTLRVTYLARTTEREGPPRTVTAQEKSR